MVLRALKRVWYRSLRNKHVSAFHSHTKPQPLFPRPRYAQETHLGEINTESIHVHAVQKAGKALAEPRQTLVHQLQLHKVLLQVCHGVAQLGESVLQALERVGGGCVE